MFGMGEQKANTLFPILQPGAVGIARLANEGSVADHGHRVEFRTIEPRSLLNRTESKRGVYFAWSINPYRGCEFGCRYCYARYTHEFIYPDAPGAGTAPQEAPSTEERWRPRDDNQALDLFEREIYIKQHAAWLLRQELKKVAPDEMIALGTATDPYQPIERRARVTRSLLEVFAEHSGLRLGIVTKSTLIERDVDLLVKIAQRNRLTLHLTITTPDAKLARVLEPRAPRPDLRFRTVGKLREAGLRVGILCSPLLPGITDTREALERMARRAKNVKASFFASKPLFLKPCSKPVFLRFIREHFPELEKTYASRYAKKAFVSQVYADRVRELVKMVVRKYGLEERFTEAAWPKLQPVWPVQGELWTGLESGSGAGATVCGTMKKPRCRLPGSILSGGPMRAAKSGNCAAGKQRLRRISEPLIRTVALHHSMTAWPSSIVNSAIRDATDTRSPRCKVVAA